MTTTNALTVRRPTEGEIKPFRKAMQAFMDTISHDAKPANLCIYAALPAANLNFKLRNGTIAVLRNTKNGHTHILKRVEMNLWLFHHPEQSLEAARYTFSQEEVDVLKKLIEEPRPWAATHHFNKLQFKCNRHGPLCYRFKYGRSKPKLKTTEQHWNTHTSNGHLKLTLYKELNALDDLILGDFDHIHFARIPFLSVPIAALFQPCLTSAEKIVKMRFLESITALRKGAPIYVLAAIREVAAYYANKINPTGIEADNKTAAQFCVDLALASVLFPSKMNLRGTAGGYVSTAFSLTGAPTHKLQRDKNDPIEFLDHHNAYLDKTLTSCRPASGLNGSDMFLAAVREIEESTRKYIASRTVTGRYCETEQKCVIFELFMPLAREDKLRMALDGLFYRDRVLRRLRRIQMNELQAAFGAKKRFPELIGYVCDWIDRNFVGYSIGHVVGRFRADHLKETREAALLDVEKVGRYLMDETTAVVRFIFPCSETSTTPKQHAERVRLIFQRIFVTQILKSVTGEAEIWLLESGMRNRLYRWEKSQ